MSSLKTFPALLMASILALPLPALAVDEAAQSPSLTIDDPLVVQFATCTGQLSAQMEFQWLLSAAEADETEAQRAVMIDLLEAVTPGADRRAALHRRLEAKVAHYRLLTRAHFNEDAQNAQWAAHQAERNIRTCLRLIG